MPGGLAAPSWVPAAHRNARDYQLGCCRSGQPADQVRHVLCDHRLVAIREGAPPATQPLPCQQNPGNRCAKSRSPRSPPTVDPEGKRSLDVQLNALFHYLLPTLTNPYITPSSCRYVSTGRWRRQHPGSCSEPLTVAQLQVSGSYTTLSSDANLDACSGSRTSRGRAVQGCGAATRVGGG
jgi:hypothetical protein